MTNDFFLSSISQSLMYNIPRTGNQIIDTLSSLLIAGLISFLVMNGKPLFKSISNKIKHFNCFRSTKRYCRTIIMNTTFSKEDDYWRDDNPITDASNKPLINAIFYYLYKNNYRLDNNSLVLAIKDSNVEENASTDYDYFNNRNIIYLPEESIISTINNKLELKYSVTSEGGSADESKEKHVELSLFSNDKEYLDDMIDTCYKDYLRECHKKKDDNKYYYEITNFRDNSIKCRSYELNNTKTIDNVFIPESESIVTLINNFINNTGPFGKTFFPKKLGWIFHGLPGCGKTSMIKAIANKTGKHILNVDFTKIKTNSELFMMFNNPCINRGHGNIKYRTSEVIYVIDDIDAGLDIIKARTIPRVLNASDTKINDNDSDDNDNDNDNDNVSNENYDSDSDQELTKVSGKSYKRTTHKPNQSTKNDDQLTLQGILNVLDGTLDSPGRILIMCTNHLNKIDPALIRPGRVNQIIEFKKMTKLMTIKYLEMCYEIELTKEQKDMIPNYKYTPAEIEEFCIENDSNLDDVIQLITKQS